MENSNTVIRRTRKWLEQFVIGLSLCPFAKKPFESERIRYVVVESEALEDLTKKLLDELYFLNRALPERIETTLIIIPNILEDFTKFNDYLVVVGDVLLELNLIGKIQVASFHPNYLFQGTKEGDTGNYTNRSPYPMLHLLREESVEQAIKNYPRPEDIPRQNIEKMNEIGLEELKNRNNDIRRSN